MRRHLPNVRNMHNKYKSSGKSQENSTLLLWTERDRSARFCDGTCHPLSRRTDKHLQIHVGNSNLDKKVNIERNRSARFCDGTCKYMTTQISTKPTSELIQPKKDTRNSTLESLPRAPYYLLPPCPCPRPPLLLPPSSFSLLRLCPFVLPRLVLLLLRRPFFAITRAFLWPKVAVKQTSRQKQHCCFQAPPLLREKHAEQLERGRKQRKHEGELNHGPLQQS